MGVDNYIIYVDNFYENAVFIGIFNRTTMVDNYRCVDGYKLVHLDKVCILLIHNLSTHQWYVDN